MSGAKSEMTARIEEAKRVLLGRCTPFPKIVIVLGSGLSEVLKDMKIEVEIPYAELPHVKSATVEGHRGRLLIGDLHGVRVACMQGRLHFYEGIEMADVVFPFRVFAMAGAEAFVLTNASGGLHPDMAPLDLCLIRDHINLMGTNPLVGPNLDGLRPEIPRFDSSLRSGFFTDFCHGRGPIEYTATTGGLRGHSRALIRNSGGNSYVPRAWWRCGRHVHCARSHRATPYGKEGRGGLVHHQPCRRRNSQPLVHSEVLENAKKAYGLFSRLLIEGVKQIGKELGGAG